jgi:hypothetical protein
MSHEGSMSHDDDNEKSNNNSSSKKHHHKFFSEYFFPKKDKIPRNRTSTESETQVSNNNKKKRPQQKKVPNKKNRLIRSMQNLLFYDTRSRSNSTDALASSSSSSTVPKSASKVNKRDRDKSLTPSSIKSFDSSMIKPKVPITPSNCNQTPTPPTPMVRKIRGVSVASKPPIDRLKHTNRQTTPTPTQQKPVIEGWLFKFKLSTPIYVAYPSPSRLNNSNNNSQSKNANKDSTIYHQKKNMKSAISATNLLSINNNNNNQRQILINSKSKKLEPHWCVLMKDYITFYKHQDDTIPKDFLLLKDEFDVYSNQTDNHNNRFYGFVIFDKSKQFELEFFTESIDECRLWETALLELRQRLSVNWRSASLSPFPSQREDDIQTSSLKPIIPESNSLSNLTDNCNNFSKNRKNNQNCLSTIYDSSDDQSSSNMHTITTTPLKTTCRVVGKSLINNNISRDSSPGSKLTSRDTSPHQNNQISSESDIDISKLNNKLKVNLNKINTTLLAANLTTAAMAHQHKQMSSSPIESKSSNNFSYDNKQSTTPPLLTETNTQQPKPASTTSQHHRCSSLPGSLQALVGSYMKPNGTNKKQPSPSPPPPSSQSQPQPQSQPPPVKPRTINEQPDDYKPSLYNSKTGTISSNSLLIPTTISTSTSSLPPASPHLAIKQRAINISFQNKNDNTFNFNSTNHDSLNSNNSNYSNSQTIASSIPKSIIDNRKPPMSPISPIIYRTEMKITPTNKKTSTSTTSSYNKH